MNMELQLLQRRRPRPAGSERGQGPLSALSCALPAQQQPRARGPQGPVQEAHPPQRALRARGLPPGAPGSPPRGAVPSARAERVIPGDPTREGPARAPYHRTPETAAKGPLNQTRLLGNGQVKSALESAPNLSVLMCFPSELLSISMYHLRAVKYTGFSA